ncbi:A/G-specific adenine glycosylase [Thalassospiraceae bacterium LMO-JJ14]|nr:A/G-specific adenine glycosylase [Thalassospiraceae bacterium LMO-JJ14]
MRTETVKTDTGHIRKALLRWYDAHRRDLPWRAGPGARPDPYKVWLSEIMLQQTTVATVGPYFGDFMAHWPDVAALAAADLDAVLVAWQGLGYYARARNLHKCARVVAAEHGGVFPDTREGLLQLPGIGPYTAAAIAAIAFEVPVMPVDGNIERVMARLFGIDTPLPKGKAAIAARAEVFADPHRPGDFAQAMMDLGATVCTPASAKCLVCPLSEFCQARASGNPERLPVRAPKAKRPERRCVMFWLENPKGEVLLRKRAETGLLGGMTELPSTPWVEFGREQDWPEADEISAHRPLDIDWHAVDGEAVHVFTHFRLTIRVLRGECRAGANADGFWVRQKDFAQHALPTVIKKAMRLVLEGE